MPAPSLSPSFHDPIPEIPDDVLRVLVTGFGPFFRYRENASWLAAKPLNNVILDLEPPPDRMIEDVLPGFECSGGYVKKRPRWVHITSLQLPLTYQAVLDIAPGLQARPPILPPSNDPMHLLTPPPETGYNFVFHLGLAGRGPLRMERLGHRIGYRMKDTTGMHAPIVDYMPDPPPLEQSQTEVLENAARLAALMGPRLAESAMDVVHSPLDAVTDSPTRGFGKGYEMFADDVFAAIDVEKLVHDLKEDGLDCPTMQNIYSSMDAGHYVNDFLYYCSLCEAKRAVMKHDRQGMTRVLFMHCPPADQPFTTQEVIEAVKKIICWVCRSEDFTR
ncbi:hypothetical protein EW146_g3146 [Bondarzewia mesenterica]|uniref:Peptidase C15, pyroglutamyl peptidase I-like protein n=1 Tax=Bondarzewia mesenterica TaxID=1095465 RepID=A0A4S4M4E0_9AGAM|nr:hypothetical protein EW146_g3146 [Bondarzewia mesenterica]